MLNHSVEREIATGLWLHESFCAGCETPDFETTNFHAEAFVFADQFDEGERIGFLAALLQCHLLVQFLRFLWE